MMGVWSGSSKVGQSTNHRIPQINLLPWRELRRIRQNERFYRAVLAVLVMSVLFVGGWYAYERHQMTHQQAINDEINRRMGVLDGDIAKIVQLEHEQQAILDKVSLIDKLGQNRMAMVAFAEHLSGISHRLVYLDHINHAGELLTIEGRASHANAVSAFAQKLPTQAKFVIDDVMVTGLNEMNGHVAFVISAKMNLVGHDEALKTNASAADGDGVLP